MSLSCGGNKEGANVICDINTKDGIAVWITTEFHQNLLAVLL